MKIQRAFFLVGAIGFMSMGNQSCDNAAQKSRVLKMEIELASLKARSVRMPTGEVIDFPYVANSLFYRQVMDHDHFVITNPVPSPLTSSSGFYKTQDPKLSKTAAAAEDGLVSSRDLSVLNRFGFLAQANDSSAQSKGEATTQATSDLPACLYDLPQALLGGEVISFEATWGVGVGVGYGAGGDLGGGKVAGNVQFDQSKLEIGLRTDDPLTQQAVAIGDGIAHQSKVSFGIDFAPGLPIGLDFFFKTPITDVIRKAMTKGLDKVVDRYTNMISTNKDWNEVWESRVLYDPELVNNDTHIAFRGGYRASVQVGDTFTITNTHYAWEGAACYTRLKYKIPLTVTPVAEAQVVSVGDNVSVAVITKYLIDQKIKPGAMVKVLKLKEPVKAKSAAVAAK